MKSLFKKIIAVISAFAISVAFVACSEQKNVSEVLNNSSEFLSSQIEDSFDDKSNSSENSSELLESAEKLVNLDQKVIELLVLGKIYENSNPDFDNFGYQQLNANSEYYNFKNVTDLLNSVYSPNGKIAERFLDYPEYGAKSVSSIDEVTYFSCHYLPEFNDKIITDTVAIVSFQKSIATFSAKSLDGKKYEFSMALGENGWRLDNSFYFMQRDSITHPSWYESGLLNGQNEGSAKRLTKKCLIINLFVDDFVSKWDENSKKTALSMLNEGVNFLSQESTQYKNTDLDITVTDLDTSLYLTTKLKVSTEITDFLWIDLLFSETIFKNLETYVKNYFDVSKYDNYCVLIQLNKSGRSYGLPCNSQYYDHELYRCERAVMFFSTENDYSYAMCPGVYAHEILHLFGAIDLYGTFISEEWQKRMNSYFPNDIMRNVNTDIGESGISPLTAYKIGWAEYLNDMFKKIVD